MIHPALLQWNKTDHCGLYFLEHQCHMDDKKTIPRFSLFGCWLFSTSACHICSQSNMTWMPKNTSRQGAFSAPLGEQLRWTSQHAGRPTAEKGDCGATAKNTAQRLICKEHRVNICCKAHGGRGDDVGQPLCLKGLSWLQANCFRCSSFHPHVRHLTERKQFTELQTQNLQAYQNNKNKL